MELRQLRYFVRIAELHSISRASRALHVAQPALSTQLTQLESELGRELLTRLPTGVRMTPEGEVFYREAQQILRQVDNVKATVGSVGASLAGRVSIGFSPAQLLQFALPLMVALREQHPDIELEVFEEVSSELLQGLASGRHDLGVVVNDEDAALLEGEALFEEELFLLSRADQAPATEFVTLADLASLPMALPGPAQLSAGLADALGVGGARSERRWIVANSVAIFRQAVLAGLAHAIGPRGVVVDELAGGRVRATPFAPRLFRTVHLCWARHSALSPTARAVRGVLAGLVRERAS